jgi:hypothetical protein
MKGGKLESLRSMVFIAGKIIYQWWIFHCHFSYVTNLAKIILDIIWIFYVSTTWGITTTNEGSTCCKQATKSTEPK